MKKGCIRERRQGRSKEKEGMYKRVGRGFKERRKECRRETEGVYKREKAMA